VAVKQLDSVAENHRWPLLKNLHARPELAIYQTGYVGHLYTCFSGPMKQFTKNNTRPVPNYNDPSQA
jgi:hypothetical protein